MVLDASVWQNVFNAGDVDHDGTVTTSDTSALSEFLASNSGPVVVPTLPDPDPQPVMYYDVDGNKVIDEIDLTLLANSEGGASSSPLAGGDIVPNATEPPVPDVNITIHNGQFGPAVPEEIEESIGGFTVANINDTDGDELYDWQDTVVLANPNTQPPTGVDEIDLMQVVVSRPANYVEGTAVSILVTGGTVQFWVLPTKQIPATDFQSGFVTFSEGQGARVAWVELPSYSSQLQSYQIEARYQGASDIVSMTAVWAFVVSYLDDSHTALTPAQIFGQFPWSNIPATHFIREYIETKSFGVGIRPVFETPVGVKNVILQEWLVYPPGIHEFPQVQFDLTRRSDEKKGAHVLGDWVYLETPFPDMLDEANDDGSNDDEYGPNAVQQMFVIDAPGFPNDAPINVEDAVMQNANFEEFVRVGLNGLHPSGNTLEGSRASSKFRWHSRMELVVDETTGKWVRSPNEGTNTIGEGHVVPL